MTRSLRLYVCHGRTFAIIAAVFAILSRGAGAQSFTEYTIPTTNSGVHYITLGPDGNLWFTENGASKIGKVTPTGTFTEYPLPAVGRGPRQITSGPDGNLWFTEAPGKRIGRITTGGVTDLDLPGGSYRLRVTLDPDETIPEANEGNNVTEVPVQIGGAPSACPVHTSTNVPVDIPDLGSVTSTLNVASGDTLTGIRVVGLNGMHTFTGDLEVHLTSPAGNDVVIMDRVCSSSDNFDLSLHDAAASEIVCPPTDGLSHLPSNPLSTFLGENPNGTWTLTIFDRSGTDIGRLEGWGLEICTPNTCPSYASLDVPVGIPDLGKVTSTVGVPTSEVIDGMQVVGLFGTHTFTGDLEFHLTSPAGTDVVIMDRVCSSSDNFDLSLHDAAVSPIACPPTDGGAHLPSNPLAAFDGENTAGTWTLTVFDCAGGDVGELLGWGLEFCSGTPCGNGSVEPGEDCDDGNQTSGDGCASDCTLESGFTFYGSRAACEAQISAPRVEDFEEGDVAVGASLSCPAPLSSTSNNACFQPGDIVAGISFQDNPGPASNGLYLLGPNFFGALSKVLVSRFFAGETTDILFPQGTSTACLDLVQAVSAASDTYNINVYGMSGELLGSTTSLANNAGVFWGVGSAVPIGRINLSSPTNQAEGVDNISFAQPAVPTSTPTGAPSTFTPTPPPTEGTPTFTPTVTTQTQTPTKTNSATPTLTPTIACTCPGDANRNGFINFADFGSVQFNFGSQPDPLTGIGDANCNGFVNFADFGSVQQSFGQSCLLGE